MPTDNWLDFLGISIDPTKAEGLKFSINLVTPDNGEKFLIEMSNGTLTNIKGVQAQKPDLTITLNRSDLDKVMMGVSIFEDLITSNKGKFEGDRKPFEQLKSILVAFTHDFEILPGTVISRKSAQNPNPFKLPDILPADSAGD